MRSLIILVPVLLCISIQIKARDLYISSGFTPPLSDLFQLILAEVDRRLDSVEITFQPMQAERSIKLVQAGINDGDCCRVPAIFRGDERLVFVNPSFAEIRWNAFTKDKDIAINSFEDLKPYAVGVVSGWKLAVNQVRMISPEHYHILDTPEQMFKMIQLQRLDVGVIGYLSGLHVLKDLKISDLSAIQPPLATTPLHLTLSGKHRDIVPEIEAVLKDMQQDGTIAKIQQLVEKDFLGH